MKFRNGLAKSQAADRNNFIHPVRILTGFVCRIILKAFMSPFLRPRISHRIIIEGQNGFFGTAVIRSSRKTLCKISKLRTPLRILLFHQLIRDVIAKKFFFPVVGNAKTGVNSDFMKMVSDNIQTKAMDGCNPGAVNQCELLLQMFISGLLLQLILQGCADPFPHLGRCRIRKGHNKKMIDVHRMVFIRDFPDDVFNQHRCLSGTGSC